MSNMQTLMIADSVTWFKHQPLPLRLLGRLLGVLSVYRMGYMAGWKALQEVIKSEPSIGKLEIDEWPESPDY